MQSISFVPRQLFQRRLMDIKITSSGWKLRKKMAAPFPPESIWTEFAYNYWGKLFSPSCPSPSPKPTALIYFLQYQGRKVDLVYFYWGAHWAEHRGSVLGGNFKWDLGLCGVKDCTWASCTWSLTCRWCILLGPRPLLLRTHPLCLIPAAQDSRWQEEERGKRSGLWHL